MPQELKQYAVKIIQGVIPDEVGRPHAFGPGLYYTSVNIHNPWDFTVEYKVKVAPSGVNGSASHHSNLTPYRLETDDATEFEASGFRHLLQHYHIPPIPMPHFLEGYFVIESIYELDVVGVYTGATLKNELRALHMEHVSPRTVKQHEGK